MSWWEIMGIFFCIFITVAILVILAFLLPVKLYFQAAGEMDRGFELNGKVMIFSGFIGGGFHYSSNDLYRAKMFLLKVKILDADVTPVVRFIRRKVKERPKKPKIEKREEKKPLVDRLKTHYRKGLIWWGYFKKGFRDFRDTVRFDHVSTSVKLGLGNPAVTGKIIGILYAINGVLPESCVITPTWDFTSPVLCGDVSIAITFFSLKFWKHVIQYTPEIARKIITHRKRSRIIITQEI